MEVKDEIIFRVIETEDADWKARFASFYSGCEIKKMGRKPHTFFAAYSGDEMVGHSVIYRDKQQWIMDGLRVKPEFRERGIGKRLTEARIRYAVENGAEEIWYACEDGNMVTTCCHLRFGFEKICPDSHRCNAATAHWFRLRITPKLFKKFPSLKPLPKS